MSLLGFWCDILWNGVCVVWYLLWVFSFVLYMCRLRWFIVKLCVRMGEKRLFGMLMKVVGISLLKLL